MRTDTLARCARARIRVPHELELVLLIGVEVAVEGARGEAQCFRDEACEARRDGRHARQVLLVGGAEGGEFRGRRPLVGRAQVVPEGRIASGERVRGGEVVLFTPVGGAGSDFVA